MLEQILRLIKDYFIREVWSGNFVISEGMVSDIDFLKEGQYFKIYGSDLNDGVYQYPAKNLHDEEFKGEIWALSIPKEVLDIAKDVDDWVAKYSDVMYSPYSSESFGGYSYSKAQGYTSTGGGMLSTWESVFASRLNQWRKVRYESAIRRNEYVRNAE